METKDYLTNYYEKYDEEGRLISKHGMVEYITTMKHIERYLKPNMRVLEIGAATGRYSHVLAQKGYRVDAVELVEHNIKIFKQNTIEGEPVTTTQGNAMDLSDFESDTYEITLLLGPMYHLFTTEDKLKALSEAIRVTKKGGIVFASYCMAGAQLLLHRTAHLSGKFIDSHIFSQSAGYADSLTETSQCRLLRSPESPAPAQLFAWSTVKGPAADKKATTPLGNILALQALCEKDMAETSC